MEKIKIKLYRQHDMDLLLLYKNKEFGFAKAVKRALHAYAAKEPYFFIPPETTDVHLYEFKKSYYTNIYLDEEKDADIIEFLKNVKKLYRNATVKSILRGAMIGPYVYGCMIHDSDREEAEDKILKKIRQDKKIENISDVPCRSKKREKTKEQKTLKNKKDKSNKSNNKLIIKNNQKIQDSQEKKEKEIVQEKEEIKENNTNIVQIEKQEPIQNDNTTSIDSNSEPVFNFFDDLNSMMS